MKNYFKVSGHHYIQNIPKSDVTVVITVAVLLFTWLLHTIQYQKYEKVVKYLKTATAGNLGIKNGGSKQTMELYKRAAEMYDAKIKELKKTSKDKSIGKMKMQKDPLFLEIVDEVSIKIWSLAIPGIRNSVNVVVNLLRQKTNIYDN